MPAAAFKHRFSKKRVLIILLVLGAITATLWLFTSEQSPIAFVIALQRAVNERERALLYETDHPALAQVMREIAQERRWASPQPSTLAPDDPLILDGKDSSLPIAARLLKPSHIAVFRDHIEFEFGGALLHFGIRTYRPGIPGEGTKRLGDGIWFYAEDGRVPSQ
jgi:hypothetical protein